MRNFYICAEWGRGVLQNARPFIRKASIKIKYVCLACLAMTFAGTALAQKLIAYHVVGDVVRYKDGKAQPLVMNAAVEWGDVINVPYAGKVELLDEKNARRITIKKAGKGTVKVLSENKNNSIAALSLGYVQYVKKQMTKKGLVSKQRYSDFACVTRERDSMAAAQKPGKKKNPFEEEFQKFKKQANKEFDDFREKCNREYLAFVREAWAEFGMEPPVRRPQEPRVKPVVCSDTARQTIEIGKPPVKRLPQKVNLVPADPERVAPKVMPPFEIKPLPIGEEEKEYQNMPVTFFGTELRVHLGEDQRINLGEISPDRVADALEYFSGGDYDNLLYDCLQIRKNRKLCDWAYLLLVQTIADQFCGAQTNEAALLAGYLYYQSGYKVRFGSVADRIYLLVASRHFIYDKESVIVDGERFYPLEDVGGNLSICRASFPKEQSLSLFIPQSPAFAETAAAEERTIASHRYDGLECKVQVNKNLIDFYDSYPASIVNQDVTSRWVMYANTPMNEAVKEQVYPALRERLKGLGELEAVERLLNLVQTGLEYEYDDKVWGGDRVFFAEESLYYPFCDCEDRAILFTRLVRDLLGLDCVLIYYPGHLAAAVRFAKTPTGVCYSLNGKDYTLCDPTYINARVGMEMPKIDNTNVTLIPL